MELKAAKVFLRRHIRRLYRPAHGTADSGPPRLGLGKEQPVAATGLVALLRGEERREAGKPLLAATDEVARGQFVGEFLQATRFGATNEGVGALPEVDALLAQAVCEPMMLVEADPRRKRQVGAHAHEHAAPAGVVDIEVVLNDPALGELQMPVVGGSCPAMTRL